ncbi:MAG: putative AMP-dependent synthetase [Puniceicoccaceae bacterium 5H]|nr:MAG: putative AMP-dependent synthetase [Puniceicoccaceae bacterium 5H]
MKAPEAPANLHDAWNICLARHAEKTALIEAATGREVSLKQLESLSSHWLQKLPPSRQLLHRRVTLALPSSIDWVAAFLALQASGACAVLVDAEMPAARVQELADELNVAAVVTREGIEARAESPRLREPYALIKLTSGSTGRPRPLNFTSAQMLADYRNVKAGMGLTEADRHYAALPLGHSYALGNLVLPLLVDGTTLVLASDIFPQAMREDFRRYQPTTFPAVPPMIRALSQTEGDAADFASLRLVVSAGAPLSPADARKFEQTAGVLPRTFYGSSETGGITFDADGEGTRSGQHLGPPLPGVEVSLNKQGRVRVVSEAVGAFSGSRKLSEGRRLYTLADHGQWDAAGHLQLLGREADWVKIGGRRVSCNAVSRVVLQHPEVAEALCLTRQGRRAEVELVLVYEGAITPEALQAWLAEQLPRWQRPRRIQQIEAFPVTARGKIDRQALASIL